MIGEKKIFDLASKKVIRDLPQFWGNKSQKPNDFRQVDQEFGSYCEKLHNSFLGIKKYYQDEFNKANFYTIDEVISLFDDAYSKIFNTLCDKNKVDSCAELDIYGDNKYFYAYKKRELCKSQAYIFNGFDCACGFSNEAYQKILPYVKQIFMLEKFCAFTTRKFWERELTNIKDLDMSKPFKILVKCVFPYTWRADRITPEISEYFKERIYSSTSLIDEKHISNLFNLIRHGNGVCAGLIVEYKDKNYVCASDNDSFSEEMINNQNNLTYKQNYSNVMLVDNSFFHKKSHKCFADAVECETPQNILNNIDNYTEINVKNAKFVGVLVPNPQSYKFSKNEAKRLRVPLFLPQGLKAYFKQNPEELEEMLNK